MDSNEKFYVGQPLKVKGITNCFYGRYYESGYECYNIPIADPDFISIVKPDGYLVSGTRKMISALSTLELKKLEKLEKQYEKPYRPRLVFCNGRYYKSEEYNKKIIDVEPNILDKIDDLCSIDKDIFGKALVRLFSIYYEKEHFLNEISIIYRGKIHSESEDYDEIQKRYAYFISPEQYPKICCLDFNHELYNPYKNAKLINGYYQATEYTTMFQQKPLSFSSEDYLMCFCTDDDLKLKIGSVKGNKFIPEIDPIYKLQLSSKKEEISFDNSNFSLANDFIVAIIDYKIKNDKLIITKEDIDIIVSEFNIEKKAKLKQMTKINIF